jgi:membrane-bound lytic murein transglycosylase D
MLARRFSAVFPAVLLLLAGGLILPGKLRAQEEYPPFPLPAAPPSSSGMPLPPEGTPLPPPAAPTAPGIAPPSPGGTPLPPEGTPLSPAVAPPVSGALAAAVIPEAPPPRQGPVSAEGRPLRAKTGAETPGFAKPEGGPYAGRGAGVPGIPGFDRPLTKQYVERYSAGGGREWLLSVRQKASPYIPFIRARIAARNLPPEFLYLPVIESGFIPTARSKSGAAGLWQFMRNSVAPFDIKINDWVDERMDFWKSTEGALRKLEDNYRALKDWPLALAAYNAGLGGIQWAVRQAGKADYWYLSEKKFIKTETIHYVPKLLAAAYILSNPRRFGLDLDWSADPRWERIPVERQTDLELLAAEAGVDAAALRAANRELLYGITPPDRNYHLKVRAADSSPVRKALARSDTVLIRHYFHTIRSGDTLSALALHYGVSAAQIAEANPGIQARYLRIGQRLRIPAYRDTGPYRRAAPAADRASAFTGSHLVKKGETLWSIARAYGIDIETLAAANNIGLNDTIREGSVLKTPKPDIH